MSCDSLGSVRLAIVSVPCDADDGSIGWPLGTVVIATSDHYFFDRNMRAIKVRHALLPAIGDGMTIPSYTLEQFVATVRYQESLR